MELMSWSLLAVPLRPFGEAFYFLAVTMSCDLYVWKGGRPGFGLVAYTLLCDSSDEMLSKDWLFRFFSESSSDNDTGLLSSAEFVRSWGSWCLAYWFVVLFLKFFTNPSNSKLLSFFLISSRRAFAIGHMGKSLSLSHFSSTEAKA